VLSIKASSPGKLVPNIYQQATGKKAELGGCFCQNVGEANWTIAGEDGKCHMSVRGKELTVPCGPSSFHLVSTGFFHLLRFRRKKHRFLLINVFSS
jgi:hypothetical protein